MWCGSEGVKVRACVVYVYVSWCFVSAWCYFSDCQKHTSAHVCASHVFPVVAHSLEKQSRTFLTACRLSTRRMSHTAT